MTDLERARDELRKARTLLARWQGVYMANAILGQTGETEKLLNDQTEEFLSDWQAGMVSGK
jgi:hypothetical protein